MHSSYKSYIAILIVFCMAISASVYGQNCSSPSNPPVVCTIWDPTTVPGAIDGGDPSAGEYGVKFKADVNGSLIGVRFYKAPANTGTHIINLWAANGTLLNSAVVSGETPSGWQQFNFSSPVNIAAGQTYIASYFAPYGHYSFNSNYFNAAVDAAPMHALANSTSVNGVYNYGSSSAFPTFTYQASNYWIDVAFVPNATIPPSIASTLPLNQATFVSLGTLVKATFNEPLDPTTITASTFLLKDSGGNAVPGTFSYNSGTSTASLKPTLQLQPLTTYTVTVKGTVADMFGNTMGSDYSWSFTTGTAPANSGPGGPILVISSSANPFSSYYSEILLNEGLNYFSMQDISTITPTVLSAYDVAILGDISLSPSQVSMLTTWVSVGGNLIAMHPDKQLAGLLGLVSTSGTMNDTYLQVNTASGPGVGIVNQTIQYHGSADLYSLNGATSVATLCSDAITTTPYPAITMVAVGSGHAAAFTYDLARSVVYTRQGNPAWSGQQRNTYVDPDIAKTVIRSDDLFFGNAAFDPQPDYVDLNKVQIPQADEQQRLLVNMIQQMNATKKPLPKFWYLPSGFKAVVIMTGDDHGNGGSRPRFDTYIADSPANCSVADWQCVRATTYMYPSTPFSSYQVYVGMGFEIANHSNTNPDCTNFTAASLDSSITVELAAMATNFPELPPSATNRTHCILWSDYDSEPQVLFNHGIRLDTSYYYWPSNWVNDRTGMFTGSGMPMRYADRNGNLFDVYQATTQIPDEDTWTYPAVIDTLLDNALGPLGYYGVFTANMHTDYPTSAGSDAIVASAQARGVPIVSSLQMLTWLDGRNTSSFGSLAWTGSSLSFNIVTGTGARNLQAMVPVNAATGSLSAISRGGTPVTYSVQTIKGLPYAFFAAVQGSYVATYGGSTGTYSISGTISGTGGDSATVTLGGTGNASAIADSAGNYSFSGLANGAYTVTPGKAGFTFTPASTSVNVNGGNVMGVNFSSVAQIFSIAGNISGPGGSGASLALTGAANTTTTSDSAGNYVFSGLQTGSYVVTHTLNGFTFSPSSQAVNVSGANLTGINFSSSVVVTLSSFALNPAAVTGGTSSTGTVTLSGAAPAGGITVTLADNSTAAQTLASITVPSGATTATFTITTSAVATVTTVTVTASYNGTAVQAGLTINPAILSSLNLSTGTLVGGNSLTGTVALNGPAPSGGAIVSLSDNSTSAQTPASITIAAGATSATFTITASPVSTPTAVTISATYNGINKQGTITINPPSLSTLSLSPGTLVGGNSPTGTVTLNGPAPTGGSIVAISDNSSAAQTPASVTVAAGSRTATFTITTSGVGTSTSATITATLGVTRTATLTITVASLSSLTLSPSTVTGGSSSTGTVTLNGAAPPTGAVILLSSSSTSVAQVPASVTIPGGSRSASFTVTTSPVHGRSARIYGTYRGMTRSATLSVQ